MKVPFLGATRQHPSIVANNQKSINWYPVESEGGVSQFSMIGSPGTRVYNGDIPAGESRGIIKWGSSVYAVIGTNLYEVSDSSFTDHGTVAGTGRVDMAHDAVHLIIVTGQGNPGYYFEKGAQSPAVTQITDVDFLGANTVTYLRGFFVFTIGDNTFYISDLNNGISFTAGQSATNNRKPDNTLNMIGDHGELFAFNETSIDVWYLTENIDFPWEQNDAASIERGCYAAWSIAVDDNTLFFLGDDLIIYRMNGYTPGRISDEGVEDALSGYPHSDLQDAYAFIYTDHGHKFYQITIPNQETWVYDLATQKWHNKKRHGLDTHHAFGYVFHENKHLILDSRNNGHILEMSRDVYQDGADPLAAIRRGQFISNEDKYVRWKKVKIAMETGVALGSTDSYLKIRHSDDRGRTFRGEKTLSYGSAQEYKKQVIRRHSGCSRVRQWEIEISDPSPRNIADIYGVIA